MRVAGYVRLSRDEDKESYSSIVSQKSIVEEYAKQQGWRICKFYEDDNCSGYTFDRPAFNTLVQDLEQGKVDIVIAKDLSRIGRHNAYTLLFLDTVKRLGKRLILPKEGNGYDTLEDESDLLGITTWYNEMYVKDISRKIKGSIKAKQKEGRMIIKEVFGYQRSSSDKHKLEIDPEAAAIVQRIFNLYLSGIGYRKIAELLNQEGCPTPSQYHSYKSESSSGGGRIAETWNSVHVQRILKNDIYIGTLRLGKTEKGTIKGKSIKKPELMQNVFLNRHPALISREQFEEVQQIAGRRKLDHSKGAASMNNLFSGLLFCQSCGSYMIAYQKQGRPKSYICGNYHKYGKQSCSRHAISENILLQIVKEFLKLLSAAHQPQLENLQVLPAIQVNLDGDLLLSKLLQERQKAKNQVKKIIFQKIAHLEKENSTLYQNIMEESLTELESELKQRLAYLEKSIQELEQKTKSNESQNQSDALQMIAELSNKEILEKKFVQILIEKITVSDDGIPTIYMKPDYDAICMHNREGVNLVLDR